MSSNKKYRCSNGTQIEREKLITAIKGIKLEKLSNQVTTTGHNFCENCNGTHLLECYHDIGFKQCLHMGRSEELLDINRFKILCKSCSTFK